jgi:hypothetical protein
MPALIDLMGKVFNRWTVLHRDDSRKYHSAHWICLCACGEVKSVDGQHLRQGRSTRCRECIEWGPRDGIPISSRHWRHIKTSAEKRKIQLDVSRREVYEVFKQQDGKCALTGSPLVFEPTRSRSDGNASLDRIDSSRGYTLDNIQWVLKRVNIMKGTMLKDELIHYCSLILSHKESI